MSKISNRKHKQNTLFGIPIKLNIGQRLKKLRTSQGLTIDALREKLSKKKKKAGIDIKGEGVPKAWYLVGKMVRANLPRRIFEPMRHYLMSI